MPQFRLNSGYTCTHAADVSRFHLVMSWQWADTPHTVLYQHCNALLLRKYILDKGQKLLYAIWTEVVVFMSVMGQPLVTSQWLNIELKFQTYYLFNYLV